MQIESFVLDDLAVHSSSTLTCTPLSIDVSTHCLLMPAMTPEIVKVMGWLTMVVHHMQKITYVCMCVLCTCTYVLLNTPLYLHFLQVVHTSFTDGTRVMGMLCCCHCIDLKSLQYVHCGGKHLLPHNILLLRWSSHGLHCGIHMCSFSLGVPLMAFACLW